MTKRQEYDPRAEARALCIAARIPVGLSVATMIEDALRAAHTAGTLGRPAKSIERIGA